MLARLNTIAFLSLLVTLGLSAQDSQHNQWAKIHESEDNYWSRKEHTTIPDVQRILSAAGWGLEDSFTIDNLDTHRLRSRKQVFLSVAESGTGHCLTVYVLQAEETNYRKIWSADQLNPEQNFCAQSLLGAAHAYASGRYVFVQMPLDLKDSPDDPNANLELLCARFFWDGKAFRLAQSDRKTIPQSKYRIKDSFCSMRNELKHETKPKFPAATNKTK